MILVCYNSEKIDINSLYICPPHLYTVGIFTKVKWLQYTGVVRKCTSSVCQIFSPKAVTYCKLHGGPASLFILMEMRASRHCCPCKII